nr:MAG TPA: PROTEIN/DNA Complex catalytic motif, Helix-turn-helix DNA [Caudoviricetes sp.]
MEQWKFWKCLPIVKVSDRGKVYDCKKNILCRTETMSGHVYVWIDVLGVKRYLLAQVVADTWLDNPNNYHLIKHIDGNNLNNSVSNLMFVQDMKDTIDHSNDNKNIEHWKAKLKKQHQAFKEQ